MTQHTNILILQTITNFNQCPRSASCTILWMRIVNLHINMCCVFIRDTMERNRTYYWFFTAPTDSMQCPADITVERHGCTYTLRDVGSEVCRERTTQSNDVIRLNPSTAPSNVTTRPTPSSSERSLTRERSRSFTFTLANHRKFSQKMSENRVSQ